MSDKLEQQRIDEARFGASLLATLELRDVSKVLDKYLELRQQNWTPPPPTANDKRKD